MYKNSDIDPDIDILCNNYLYSSIVQFDDTMFLPIYLIHCFTIRRNNYGGIFQNANLCVIIHLCQ